MTDRERPRQSVIGTSIDALDWDLAIARIGDWARQRSSHVVCICNAHSIVTARQDSAFAQVLEQADMATPDGAPVAWMLRRLGVKGQVRINGPDLMWKYCAYAAHANESIYLYGGTDATLAALKKTLLGHFPGLTIAGDFSPPFRQLTATEEAEVVDAINNSGASVVWVGLGCPKQEKWMAAHRGRIHAVMVGVGAAFDYHAGTLQRAPKWMQDRGLEWVYRLCSEPRRLWRRYLVTNTLFICYAVGQLLGVPWGRRE